MSQKLTADLKEELMKKKCQQMYTACFAVSTPTDTTLKSQLPRGMTLSSSISSLPIFLDEADNSKEIHECFLKLITGDLPMVTGPHYLSADQNFLIARKGFTFGVWIPSQSPPLFHLYQCWDAPLYVYRLELEEDGTWRYILTIFPPGFNIYKVDASLIYVLFAGGDTRIQMDTVKEVNEEALYVEEIQHTHPPKEFPILHNICSPWTKTYWEHLQESSPPIHKSSPYQIPEAPPFLQNTIFGFEIDLDTINFISPILQHCRKGYKQNLSSRRNRLLSLLYGPKF